MRIVLALALAVGLAGPAFAQQVDIRATPPSRESHADITAPGPFHEITVPRENEWYPDGVRVPFDPAFIGAEEYETSTTRGQYGVAGWTAQNIPVGPSGTHYRDQAGWPMFGFVVTWGAAPRSVRPAPVTPRPPGAPTR